MRDPGIFLQAIETAIPTLPIQFARLFPKKISQFNDVLVVNESLIFRFPRLANDAKILRKEVQLLNAIRDYVTLPIPDPIYNQLDKEPVFMGYPMLPGKPLRQSVIDSLGDDVRQQLAQQLAQFALELHSLPIDQLDITLPNAHNVSYWQRMYKAFREELFPHMRLDACQQVILSFEAFLSQPPQFTPVLCHGDLGTGNILYDPEQQAISGVIDFGSSALGDPAFDIASLSSCGEAFMTHFRQFYPNIEALESRARFYKSTFALQQALWARRGGDQAAFEDGIAAYV